MSPASVTARCIAMTLAVTSAASGPVLPPIPARASAFAPAVTPSICEEDADSVRSSTAASGAQLRAGARTIADPARGRRRDLGIETGDLAQRVLSLGLQLGSDVDARLADGGRDRRLIWAASGQLLPARGGPAGLALPWVLLPADCEPARLFNSSTLADFFGFVGADVDLPAFCDALGWQDFDHIVYQYFCMTELGWQFSNLGWA